MIAFPLLVVYFLLRGIRERRYFVRLWERLGFLPHAYQGTAHGAIWLHAVSVGEVISAAGLLKKLRETYPARRLFVSSTTLAGRALAEEKLAGVVDGVFYAPVDYCFAVRSVLRRLRPSVVVVLETEIWPNLYREVKRTGAGLLLANSRISDKALPRYRCQRWFLRHVFKLPDEILAQSAEAAGRYIEIGAPPARVTDAGNLKYDFEPAAAAAPEVVTGLVERARPAQIWIAASTMPPAAAGDIDEDDVVIAAFVELAAERKRLLLILVPRRPVRFDEAAGKLRAAGVRFLRRSELSGGETLELPGVLLLDSIGELGSLFPLADVVFMGGSLADRGGHNILEPACFGKPIVNGPHLENFSAIAADFRAGGGLVEINSPGELAGAVGRLLDDAELRARAGERARELAEARRGATDRIVEHIERLSSWSVAELVRSLPARLPLWALSWVWAAGAAVKQRRARGKRRALQTPVVSIGGISMGGAGKTPFTLHLARRFREETRQPAILTRGYRRRVPEKSTVLAAGSTAKITLTGDEAQLFLRSGVVHVGIGADRYRTGRAVEEKLHPDLILLDDGFQHWQLARDLDVVLIDALDPFGGGALFPLGHLREPLTGLDRAGAFLITKIEPGSPVEGIKELLRRHNERAPVFCSRVVPRRWIEFGTKRVIPVARLDSITLAGFCGLANPASFWRTLASMGGLPVKCWAFGDHHHYSPLEVKRMAANARAAGAHGLVTTEKDVMNLPVDAAELIKPLPLYWLEIDLEIENEEELLALIREKLKRAPATASASDPARQTPPPASRG